MQCDLSGHNPDTPLEARLRATGDYDQARIDFLRDNPSAGSPRQKRSQGLSFTSPATSRFTTGTMNIVDGGWAL